MTDTLENLRAGKLAGAARLKLSCSLEEFPPEIYSLASTLEILDLTGNRLKALPQDFDRLQNLRVLFCSDNLFTELPTVLGQCPHLSMVGFKANKLRTIAPASLPPALRWLILTDNRIEKLPDEIGNCRQLQKLMLAGNCLTDLPRTLSHCSELELLRIAANRLEEFPAWLLAMPRLAWLAFAGNPFCQAREDAALENDRIASLPWASLYVGEQLGQGASGVIHAVTCREPVPGKDDYAELHTAQIPLALKLFKGDVTSDGLPASEMAACFSAGSHENLIPILGRLDGHPDARAGMLMPQVSRELVNLAGSPSLESCTRDVYGADITFTFAELLGIASAAAGAAGHLAAHGILHGDLYGHNILHDRNGHALLGDFGAASLYDANGPCAGSLQRLEVRAFGYLLEELLERLEAKAEEETKNEAKTKAGSSAHMASLLALKTACLAPVIRERPDFARIGQVLAACHQATARPAPGS